MAYAPSSFLVGQTAVVDASIAAPAPVLEQNTVAVMGTCHLAARRQILHVRVARYRRVIVEERDEKQKVAAHAAVSSLGYRDTHFVSLLSLRSFWPCSSPSTQPTT